MAVIVKLGEGRRSDGSRPMRSVDDDEPSFLAHPAVAGSIIGLALLVLLVVGIITFRNTAGQEGVNRQRAQAAALQSQQDEQERLRPRGQVTPMPVQSRDTR
jgi:hypothetical protein